MATQPGTVDFVLDQLISLDNISTRKMFGEYALYCNDKVVGLICDETLYIKITDAWKAFIGNDYKEGFAYPGAKASMVIDEERIEDHEWLSNLVRITYNSLPIPKMKKSKTIL